jgi:hypothetical protein
MSEPNIYLINYIAKQYSHPLLILHIFSYLFQLKPLLRKPFIYSLLNVNLRFFPSQASLKEMPCSFTIIYNSQN